MANAETVNIEIVYALPDRAYRINLNVKAGTTIHQAIRESGILQQCPEIDLAVNKVGIYGRIKTTETELKDGDRVEIYRELKADPREARRRRAQK